ncbi:MAG: ABC transporter substrate-binding protein [Spirochaetales bacterium]|nr:ABC transporter substrate-binding protein [Spirochaetales bacterium]
MRRFRFLFLVFALVLGWTGSLAASGQADAVSSSSSHKKSSKSLVVRDFHGREIQLDEPAQRVVALSPVITETVFALEQGNSLVGKTEYCDYPPEAQGITTIGSLREPDIEAIAALEPDLVVASAHFSEEHLRQLEALGITVAVLMAPDSLRGGQEAVIRPLATLLGAEDKAKDLILQLNQQIDAELEKVKSFQFQPRVYYVVGFGDGGDWTAGGDTFIGEMIELAGGENIAQDTEGWSFSLEALVARDPDVIFIPSWADGVFQNSPVYSDLRAVQSGNVFVVDENTIVRQGPRIGEGLASLVSIVAQMQ